MWSLCALGASAGVTIVPAPPLVLDGSVADVVLLVDPPRASVKVVSADGRIDAVVVDGSLVTVSVLPAHVGALVLEVRAGGVAVPVEVAVVEAPKPVTVSVDPPDVKPGGAATITVLGTAPAVWISTSAGTVSAPTPVDGGFSAKWTAPKTAGTVAISATDATHPALTAKTSAQVGTTAGRAFVFAPTAASVPTGARVGVSLVVVGDRLSAPIPNATGGTLVVDGMQNRWVWTTPDVPGRATLSLDIDGLHTERIFEVVDPGAAVGVVPAAITVVSDGPSGTIAVVDRMGLAVPSAPIEVTALSGGLASLPTATNIAGRATIDALPGAPALVRVTSGTLVGGAVLVPAAPVAEVPVKLAPDDRDPDDALRVAAPTADTLATLRAGLVLTNAHGAWQQRSDGAGNFLGEAAYVAPALGFFGVGLGLEALPLDLSLGALGAEVGGRAELELYGLDDRTRVVLGRDWHAGLLLRRPGALAWRFGLGVAQPGSVRFGYTDDTLADLRASGFVRTGVRASVGIEAERPGMTVAVGLAETFAFTPARTELTSRADLDVAFLPALLRIGADAAYTGMRYVDGDAVARARQFDVVLSAGIAVRD